MFEVKDEFPKITKTMLKHHIKEKYRRVLLCS